MFSISYPEMLERSNKGFMWKANSLDCWLDLLYLKGMWRKVEYRVILGAFNSPLITAEGLSQHEADHLSEEFHKDMITD